MNPLLLFYPLNTIFEIATDLPRPANNTFVLSILLKSFSHFIEKSMFSFSPQLRNEELWLQDEAQDFQRVLLRVLANHPMPRNKIL